LHSRLPKEIQAVMMSEFAEYRLYKNIDPQTPLTVVQSKEYLKFFITALAQGKPRDYFEKIIGQVNPAYGSRQAGFSIYNNVPKEKLPAFLAVLAKAGIVPDKNLLKPDGFGRGLAGYLLEKKDSLQAPVTVTHEPLGQMTSAKQQEALNLLAKTQYTAQDLKMIDHYISLYEKSGVAELRAEIRSREGKSVYDTWSPTDYNYVEAQQVKHREFGTVHQYKELLVRKQILNRQIELKQKYPKLKLTGRADQLPPDVYLKKIASFSGKVEQQADNLKVTLVKNVTLPDAPYLLQVEIDNKVVGYKTLDPKLNVNQAKTYIQKFSKDLFEVKQQLEENKKLILLFVLRVL
jgi:Tfp pilus assembly protein PilN